MGEKEIEAAVKGDRETPPKKPEKEAQERKEDSTEMRCQEKSEDEEMTRGRRR